MRRISDILKLKTRRGQNNSRGCRRYEGRWPRGPAGAHLLRRFMGLLGAKWSIYAEICLFGAATALAIGKSRTGQWFCVALYRAIVALG